MIEVDVHTQMWAVLEPTVLKDMFAHNITRTIITRERISSLRKAESHNSRIIYDDITIKKIAGEYVIGDRRSMINLRRIYFDCTCSQKFVLACSPIYTTQISITGI